MNNSERIDIAIKACHEAAEQAGLKFSRTEVVGSTYIRDATDSDVDVLILVPSGELSTLVLPGWTYGGSGPLTGNDWCSWTREVDGVIVNLIIVTSIPYYSEWLTAAEVCRFLHLRGITPPRGAVHGVHAIIMDGSDAAHEATVRDYD